MASIVLKVEKTLVKIPLSRFYSTEFHVW